MLLPISSNSIFWTMKVATVFDKSEPVSIILKHKGIISVCKRNPTTSVSSTYIYFNFFFSISV